MRQVLFFLLINITSGFLVGIGWLRNFMRFIFTDRSRFSIYHLLVWWHLSILHNSQWITFPTRVIPVFVLLLYQFVVFIYYVINSFISITQQATLAILLCIINFCFGIISRYAIIAWWLLLLLLSLLLLLYTLLEFFTSALTDGFPLEFEWAQVSSSLQDSSQDSGRS